MAPDSKFMTLEVIMILVSFYTRASKVTASGMS